MQQKNYPLHIPSFCLSFLSTLPTTAVVGFRYVMLMLVAALGGAVPSKTVPCFPKNTDHPWPVLINKKKAAFKVRGQGGAQGSVRTPTAGSWRPCSNTSMWGQLEPGWSITAKLSKLFLQQVWFTALICFLSTTHLPRTSAASPPQFVWLGIVLSDSVVSDTGSSTVWSPFQVPGCLNQQTHSAPMSQGQVQITHTNINTLLDLCTIVWLVHLILFDYFVYIVHFYVSLYFWFIQKCCSSKRIAPFLI